MIHFVTGDILLTKAQIIAHGVAPGDHFNQGLALALRERFPNMAKDFRHYCHQSSPESGEAWFWASPEKLIINLMTQQKAENENAHPGKATLSNVDHALKAARKIIEKEGLASIALPRLATGVGGLAWDDVKALIKKNFEAADIAVFVYEKYAKDVVAQETL